MSRMVASSVAPAASLDEAQAWHAVSVTETSRCLGADCSVGLSPAEANRRLERYGPNTLEVGVESTWWTILGRQFRDLLTLILLVAALMSIAVGEPIDAAAILAIVILNGLLGFVQEWKAENALVALRQMLSPRCTVVRSGEEQIVESRELVAGDLVQLDTGAHIPADLRLVQVQELRVDESALTGESDSVLKMDDAVDADAPVANRTSMAWMGTAVTAGRALGLVVATGARTQFGRISEATSSIRSEPTQLQKKMAVLGRQLAVAAIAIAAIVALLGYWRGRPWTEMLFTGVSLAVAVVPEGLPAVVTLTMAFGIRAMIRRRALLRRMQAAESLGAATIVCTDKTGTLTQNQMTVRRIWLPSGELEVTGTGYDPAGHFEQQGQRCDYRRHHDLLRLLQTGLQCNHAKLRRTETDQWERIGEPTECALVVAGYKAWLDVSDEQDTVVEFGFDSRRKRMTVVKRVADHLVAHIKALRVNHSTLYEGPGWGCRPRP